MPPAWPRACRADYGAMDASMALRPYPLILFFEQPIYSSLTRLGRGYFKQHSSAQAVILLTEFWAAHFLVIAAVKTLSQAREV